MRVDYRKTQIYPHDRDVLLSPNFSCTSSCCGSYVGIFNLDIHWKASDCERRRATSVANKGSPLSMIEIRFGGTKETSRQQVYMITRCTCRIQYNQKAKNRWWPTSESMMDLLTSARHGEHKESDRGSTYLTSDWLTRASLVFVEAPRKISSTFQL
jgi:hypothetical protein